MEKYSLFLPPQEIIYKKSSEFTKKEALLFFEFVMAQKIDRKANLLNRLNISPFSSENIKILYELNEAMYTTLKLPEFSKKGNSIIELTNSGFSLCWDLGLLIGDLVIQRMAGVRWAIGKGPKSYTGKNMPVIRNDKEEYDVTGIAIQSNEFALNNNTPKNWVSQIDTMLKTLNDPLWFKKM